MEAQSVGRPWTWQPTPREQAEQAAARAALRIEKFFERGGSRADLVRARRELDLALRLTA
jgi:hypothetical protein